VEAEQAGDYLSAAQHYLELAKSNKGKQQAYYYLRAAQAYFQLNDFNAVTTTLANIDNGLLTENQLFEISMIEATMALNNSQPEQGVAALSSYDLNNLTANQKKSMLELRIKAYTATQNWLEKANSHLALANLLTDSVEQDNNQQGLWQALMQLTPHALDLFNPGIPPAVDSGWFALAYAVRTYQTNPDALVVAIEDWQRVYPNHPANPDFYKALLKTGTRLPTTLNDIAVLLPTKGPYAQVADAIKQGIIAAHFNAGSSARLHFFATDSDERSGQSNVWQQYQAAVDLNANLVIGPLDKTSVQILADAETLPVPVLALNRLNDPIQKQNLFQFGLAPEDDAIAAANFALSKQYQRAAIITPRGEWGKRVADAFSEQWLDNGGTLLNEAFYDESQSDFSAVIKPLFSLDSSKQREQSLKQALGRSIESEPRRRQDIDFLFLVARPLKARQLLPQLKFHRSGQLPVLSTSHAYSGQENSQQDIDLNGLMINDIPWVFNDIALVDPTYISLKNTNSANFEQFVRLYALGVDAYKLIPELNAMSRSSELKFNGATGVLSIDETGLLNRETRWAKFNNGKITPLATTVNIDAQ
jgi:outer membrane PBP1 activator LpoA protein